MSTRNAYGLWQVRLLILIGTLKFISSEIWNLINKNWNFKVKIPNDFTYYKYLIIHREESFLLSCFYPKSNRRKNNLSLKYYMFSIICDVLFLICKLNNLAFLLYRMRTRKATRSQSCTNNIAETLPSSSAYSLSDT